MATRRTPPRRRPRKESSGAKNVLVGGTLLIAMGLVVGTIMAHHHDKAPAKPVHGNAQLSSMPSQHPRVSLLPPVRPETLPPVTPVRKPTHHHPKKLVHHPVRHPQPRYTRFPVTPEMLLGEAANPRYDTPNPEPPASVMSAVTTRPRHAASLTLRPTMTPAPPLAPATASPSPSPQPTRKRLIKVKVVPVLSPIPTATHWHPRAHWTPRPHWTPVPKWHPHEIPNAIDTPARNADATVLPLVVIHRVNRVDAVRAEGVVRRYLVALKHGDETTAYHYLGGAPGAAGLSLSEEGFIDRTAEISSLKVQSDPQGQNIQAEVAAKRGLYIVTFRVEKRHGRQIITSHDYFKP